MATGGGLGARLGRAEGVATVGTCARPPIGAETGATACWRFAGADCECGGAILANVGGWTFPGDAVGADDARGLGGEGVTFAKVGAFTDDCAAAGSCATLASVGAFTWGGATGGAAGRFDGVGALTSGRATGGGRRLESDGAFNGGGAPRVGVVLSTGTFTGGGATLETRGFGSATAPRDAAGGRIAGGDAVPPRLAVWGDAMGGSRAGPRIIGECAIGPLGWTVLGGRALPPNTAEL